MREAVARQIYRVWHKPARRQAVRRGAALMPPGYGPRGLEDANGDRGVKEAFLKDAALRK